MAETVWVLCESGAILPHDLPLPEGLSQRVKTGEAKLVAGPDGGELVEPVAAAPVEPEPVEVPAVEPVVEPEPVEAVTEPEPVEPEPVVVAEPEKKVRVPRQRTAPQED